MVEYWKKAAIVLGVGTWSDSLDFGVLMTALTLLIVPWGLGPIELSLISAIPTYIGLGASLIIGPLVDFFGRKRMWIIGNSLPGLAYLIGAFICRTWVDLMIVRIFGVLGTGWTIATYFSWLPEILPADKRQRVMGAVGMLQILAGMTLSALLALTAIFPWINWQIMFIWAAIWDLAVVILGAFVLKESELWLERRKLAKEKAAAAVEVETRMSYRALFTRKWAGRVIIGLLIGLTYSMFGLFTASGVASHWSIVILKFEPWLLGILGLIGTPIVAVYRPIVGLVSDKIGRLKNLLLFNLIGLPAAILGALTPVIVGVGMHLHVIAYSFILGQIAGLMSSGQEDTGKLVLSELVPTTARATAHSLLELIKGLVLGTVTMITGIVYSFNPILGMMFPAILGSIVGLSVVSIAIRLGYETKGKMLE